MPPQIRQSVAGTLVLLTGPPGTGKSTLAAHRERVEGRARAIPGWHELDWDHVSEFLRRWTPPADVDLELDAMNPLESNAARLAAVLA